MNAFDASIIEYLNQYARQSWTLDHTIHLIEGNHLIKGGILMLVFWWAWFRDGNRISVRPHLVSTLAACFVAIAAGRMLARVAPFRPRPLHDDSLGLTLPYSMSRTILEGWSAFPSDHAVLFYALATGMFFISARVGIFAILFVPLVISLPRVYLGLHYPTDIAAGAAVGIAIALLFNLSAFNERVSKPIASWSETRPEYFYPILFLATFQVVDMIDSTRFFLKYLHSIVLPLII